MRTPVVKQTAAQPGNGSLIPKRGLGLCLKAPFIKSMRWGMYSENLSAFIKITTIQIPSMEN